MRFVLNFQIKKNIIFDRATKRRGPVFVNPHLPAGKQAFVWHEQKSDITFVVVLFVMVYFPSFPVWRDPPFLFLWCLFTGIIIVGGQHYSQKLFLEGVMLTIKIGPWPKTWPDEFRCHFLFASEYHGSSTFALDTHLSSLLLLLGNNF